MTDLRIAVIGVGMMGADHVQRLTSRIAGARVAVVNDYLTEKAEQVAASVPGARVEREPFDAITADDVDAVLLATPGSTHEKQLLACLEHRKPVLCEKPLTTEVETALEIVRREAEREVRTEVVGERGSATIGLDVAPGFRERFAPAYDVEVQRWVDAVRSGVNVDGPTAWDGYAAAAVCEAGVRSLYTGEPVSIELAERSGF